jgi:hypothetical protein
LTIEPDPRSKVKPAPRRFEVFLTTTGFHQPLEYSGKRVQVKFNQLAVKTPWQAVPSPSPSP